MDIALDSLLQSKGGLLLSKDLLEMGLPKASIANLVRSGVLTRVRRGALTSETSWRAASPDARHRLLVRATDGVHPADLVFSHFAAAAMHRLPLIGTWPTRVHVLDSSAGGGSSMPSLFLHRTTESRENVLIDEVWVTSLDRTLVDVSCSAPFLQAVAMIDFAMHSGLTSTDSLLDELAYVNPGRGGRRAAQAIYFGDGRSESVGESLSRVRMWELGFAMPELQVEFRSDDGPRSIVDFFWPRGRIVGEFDGRDKYRNPLYTRGRSTEDVGLAEKDREDRIRPQVERFIRWGWNAAWDGPRFGNLLRSHSVPMRSATF